MFQQNVQPPPAADEVPLNLAQQPLPPAAGIGSYQNRLAAVVAGAARTFVVPAPPEEAVMPVDEDGQGPEIVGQAMRGGDRMGGYRDHYYVAHGAEVTREYRIGAMLYDRNITNAFDYFGEGQKYACPQCTVPPYNHIDQLQLEQVWCAGVIATIGQCGGNPPDAVRMPLMVGNIFAVGLPDQCVFTVADSNRFILSGARHVVQNAPDDLRADLALRFPQADWNDPEHANGMPVESIPGVITSMAICLSAQARHEMMSTYVGIFLAYTKQGNITQRKLNQIYADLYAQGMSVTLTPAGIRDLWAKFGSYFDDGAASDFFPRWQALMTGRCMRLRLVFQQAAKSGLTGLTLCRDMVNTYPDFRWDLVASKCPEEWANFLAAHAAVGDDDYWGFRKDLGVAAAVRYKSIIYVSKKLRQNIMGDQNMRNLATISNFNIPDAPFLDNLVQRYRNYVGHHQIGGNAVAAQAFFPPGAVPANFLAQQNAPVAAQAPAPEEVQQNLANMLAMLGLGGGAAPAAAGGAGQ